MPKDPPKFSRLKAAAPAWQFGLGVNFGGQEWPMPGDKLPSVRDNEVTVITAENADVKPLSAKLSARDRQSLLAAAGASQKTDTLRRWHDRHARTLVVRLRANEELTEPIHVDWRLSSAWRADRLLVIAEKGSRGTIIERVSGSAKSARTNSVIVHAEADASVTHVRVQNLPADATEYVWREASVAAGASVTWLDCSLGGSAIGRSMTRLVGKGAAINLRRLAFGDGARRFAADDSVRHEADNTASEIVFRGAAGGESRLVNRNRVAVPHGLSGCRVLEKSDTIIWSKGAWAAALPEMSVATPNADCRHAASTGSVDANRVFYLQSRGLDRATAVRLVVSGFLAPAITEMRAAGLLEMIECLIDARFNQSLIGTESTKDYDCQ